MKPLSVVLILTLAHVVPAWQESPPDKPSWTHKFEDFRVDRVYPGMPAPAVIATRSDRQFRTRIREGASKGPNFAGHYTIVKWGCGSGCISFVVVDTENGKVSWSAPFGILGVPFQGSKSGREYRGLQYKADSRLLVADGCPEDRNCGIHYFEWVQGKFQKRAFEPDPPAKE